jgi:hypothetical protein
VFGVGGVWLLAKVVPVGLGDVNAIVLCGGLDVGEGLFALVVGNVFDLVEAGDGVANMGGVVQWLLPLVGEGVDRGREVVAFLGVEGFVVFMMLPGCFHLSSGSRSGLRRSVMLRVVGCAALARRCEVETI